MYRVVSYDKKDGEDRNNQYRKTVNIIDMFQVRS